MTRLRVLEFGAALVVAFVVLVPVLGLFWSGGDEGEAQAQGAPATASCEAAHSDPLEKKGHARREKERREANEEDEKEKEAPTAKEPKPSSSTTTARPPPTTRLTLQPSGPPAPQTLCPA